MADKPTNTPEYGCVSDLAAQQAATADTPPKKGKTETPAAPDVADKE